MGNCSSRRSICRRGLILCLLVGGSWLGGCGPTVQTRTSTWPNGKLRASESYYVDSSGERVLHGVSTYWDPNGVKIAEGTWRDGKPINGVCWIPAAGDAGSWGGLGHFEKYQAGTPMGKVRGNP